jgi:tetratricopeptide (TPR) repeat protein
MKALLVSFFAFSLFCAPVHAASAVSQSLLPEAARLLEEGHFEEAAAAFEKLSAELRPGDQRAGSVWRGLGVSYANLGENEKAIHAFTASLQAEPRSTLTQIYLGACYRLEDRPLEAVTMFLAALAIDPKLERAHDELWQSYAALGEQYGYDTELTARELYHLGKLLEINPEYAKGFPGVLAELKYLRSLKALFEAGESGRVFREGVGAAEAATPTLPEDGISPEERRTGIALAEKF